MSKETTKNEAVYDFKETAPAFFSDVLPNRIDFVGIVTVDGANPNGDPSGEGLPRQDTRGYGELSDVCLKHKIRNQFIMRYAEDEGRHPENDVLVIDDDYMENRAACIEEKLEYKFDGELARILFPTKSKDEPQRQGTRPLPELP